MEIREKIIVALDLPNAGEALQLIDRLEGRVARFKIGLQLFTAEGPSIVQEVRQRGGRVFLDLKLHDIPSTVALAALSAVRLGVEMMTLHTCGGQAMLWETSESVREFWGKTNTGSPRPWLLGVTVLTSMDKRTLQSVGVDRSPEEQVLRMGRLAVRSGLDGVVCSPREAPALRRAGLDLKLVTPGIRPEGSSHDDQARVMSPRQALLLGADYLVIGRPITRADDPAAAVDRIVAEME